MFKTCNLTRNYSVASLIGIVLVAVSLVYFYQATETKALMERESQANADLARTIANTFWPKYADFISHAGEIPIGLLASQPEIEQINQDILHKIRGLRVAKVKIYDLNGLVVFSTQASQIGDNKAHNSGFQDARGGRVASEIIFRDSFSSFEGSIYDRNLVASYVPVRSSFDQPVEAVFEIYSDITPLLGDIEKTRNHILLVITSLMVMLYLFLLLIVRRAQKQLDANAVMQRRDQQHRLDYLEYHDEVTGLLNRKGLLRQMQHYVLADNSDSSVGLGVVAIKLRNLGAISGGLGHQRVKHLLRLAAERIKGCASQHENVSHLDSSEFVLIVENLFSDSELDFLVDKLNHFFAEPIDVDGKSVALSIAIGVDSSWGGKSCESLVNNALLALSECKVLEKHYLRYDDSMELKKQEYLNLEIEISRALQQREFTLYYQPKVNVQSGEVTGMEALLRWQHPQRGLVMPGGFISLLEERGYIIELGEWLLHEACKQCRTWHQEGHEHLRVAVNVSLKQLDSKAFVKSVAEALSESGLPPQALELELTESILVKDTERVTAMLRELKGLGVRLSIDDFGTGYSSLGYLTQFPFDYLKIDRTFIRDMMHNHDHEVLTGAIITMAKSLNMGVVAEGIETQEQLRLVRDMGCDEVQGFYFSQAVEPAHFVNVLSGINANTSAQTHH